MDSNTLLGLSCNQPNTLMERLILANKLIENTVTGALITAPLEGIANFAWCQVQFDRIAMGLDPNVELETNTY